MCVSYAASRRVRWNAPIGYYVGVNDSICVSTQIARNSRKLVRIRGRYPEGTKRKRIPGPGLFVLYVRSAPCCVYLGPPISPQSGIFSQMRRLEQTPLRLSIKADSLMWTTMKRFGRTPALVLAFVVTLPIFLSLTFVPSIYRLLFHYLTTSCGNHATGQGIFRSCIWSTRFHSRRSLNSRINVCCLYFQYKTI